MTAVPAGDIELAEVRRQPLDRRAVAAGRTSGAPRSRSSSRTWTIAWASAATDAGATMTRTMTAATGRRATIAPRGADERDQDRDGDRAERPASGRGGPRASRGHPPRTSSRRHALEQRPAGDVHHAPTRPRTPRREERERPGSGSRPTIASGAPHTTRPIANGPASRRRRRASAATVAPIRPPRPTADPRTPTPASPVPEQLEREDRRR